MSDIVKDIVDEIQIKPARVKLVLKWVISISISAIVIAFSFGQIKNARSNRLNNFEKALTQNTAAMTDLRNEMKAGFNELNLKIDKVYTDGYKAFDEYSQFNKEQLILVLDYGQENKELLKKMLELNTLEKTKSVENQLEQSKIEKTPEYSIQVRPVVKQKEYLNLIIMTPIEGTDTTFHLVGATKEYINKIDRNKYEVGQMIANDTHPGLYDVNYRTK